MLLHFLCRTEKNGAQSLLVAPLVTDNSLLHFAPTKIVSRAMRVLPHPVKVTPSDNLLLDVQGLIRTCRALKQTRNEKLSFSVTFSISVLRAQPHKNGLTRPEGTFFIRPPSTSFTCHLNVEITQSTTALSTEKTFEYILPYYSTTLLLTMKPQGGSERHSTFELH